MDKRAKSRRNIRQVDIVSVHEDKTQRQMGRLGRIMKLLSGEVTAEEDHSDDERATTTPIRVVSDTEILVDVLAQPLDQCCQ